MAKLKVVDFFCGAGGFSEGFRQAGFDVVLAVDNWQPAVNTHNENHPEGLAILDDVIRISNLSDKEFHELIPDTEVIVGSPPCTDFSNSNRSGNADKSKGVELVEAYLRIIARKKYKPNSILKYWILENVPKVEDHIKDVYLPKELKLEGGWEFQTKFATSGIYNAKFYGVPSNRKRYFCGDFPKPEITINDDSQLIVLKDILKALGLPKEKLHSKIIDPIYKTEFSGEEVTDHHYFQYLSEFEKKKATRLKQDKGFMGKMSIPENKNKPARTIMATMSFTSRECFVLGEEYSNLRAPTIREVATLMSFPIDYRFYGKSLGLKYRQVGNAVPPKMSYALAKAIVIKEDLGDSLNGYNVIEHAHKLTFLNLNLNEIAVKIEKPKSKTAKFKYHIPYFKFETYRVELLNVNSDFENLQFKWSAEIHYNQGKENARMYTPDISDLEISKADVKVASKFFSAKIKKQIVNHNEFQRIHCLTAKQVKNEKVLGPYKTLDLIREFLDSNFEFGVKKEYVLLQVKPKIIPRPIAIGYYILKKFVNLMQEQND